VSACIVHLLVLCLCLHNFMLGIRKQVLNGTPPHNVICLHLAK
jgi:hypothetical protein